MTMILDPVEVFGSSPGGEYKVKVGLDNGTEMGSLTGSVEGFHDEIPCGSFLGDSLGVTTMGSLTGSLEGSHDGMPCSSFL